MTNHNESQTTERQIHQTCIDVFHEIYPDEPLVPPSFLLWYIERLDDYVIGYNKIAVTKTGDDQKVVDLQNDPKFVRWVTKTDKENFDKALNQMMMNRLVNYKD